MTTGETSRGEAEDPLRGGPFQIYQVAYVVVKMAISPRPGTWVLEKSLDGQNWQAWQYYATSDAECMRQFGVPATTGVPRFQRDDEVGLPV